MEDRGFETPCWVWTKSRTVFGYGQVTIAGKIQLCHRVMWRQTKGWNPGELHHLCEQPACINPDHLREVDHAENIQLSPQAKITLEQARAIKGDPRIHRVIGAEYGISGQQVGSIKLGKCWPNA